MFNFKRKRKAPPVVNDNVVWHTAAQDPMWYSLARLTEYLLDRGYPSSVIADKCETLRALGSIVVAGETWSELQALGGA